MDRFAAAANQSPRVLLLLPTTSYRNEDFIAAANALGVTLVVCANYCHQLAPGWGLAPMRAVHFDQPEQAAAVVLRGLGHELQAVLAVDDQGLELAALLNERLGLPGNSPQAVRTLRDKLSFRELLNAIGLNCPRFWHLPDSAAPESLLGRIEFPVVVKARRLSGSRGVIRADTPGELLEACARVRSIQTQADRDSKQLGLLMENFIPGTEYALEGLLDNGRLRALALFDKPDPLNGPYFEETLYVAPSRLPAALQEELKRRVEQVCRACALVTGPIHAEARINDAGAWLLEIAARSIGGLCSRVLRHALGMSLEELILRHALRLPIPDAGAVSPCGVMMIPIPRRGILRKVDNREAAVALPGIEEIAITASPGQLIAPPPEGSSYLGFIFAHAATPEAVEHALRAAAQFLKFDIQGEVPVVESSVDL